MSRQREKKHSPLPRDVKDRLETVEENTELLHKQITEGRSLPHHGVSVDLLEFHTKFFQSGQRVSDSCTKLAVLFSKPVPPTVEEAGVICGRIEQSTLHLASTCFQISPAQGITFVKEVQEAALRILEGSNKLIKVLVEKGSSGNARLHGTGTVWEYCDSVAKVSRDNRSAAFKVFIFQLHLLKDACSEIEELEASNGLGDDMDCDDFPPSLVVKGLSGPMASMVLTDSGSQEQAETSGQSVDSNCEGVVTDGPREWNEHEAKLARPCIRLIQLSAEIVGDTSRLVITHGSVEQLEELDRAAESVQQISPIVDDLGDELSAPVAMEKCRKLCLKLHANLQSFIDVISDCHFCEKAGKTWRIEKYRKAITDAVEALPA